MRSIFIILLLSIIASVNLKAQTADTTIARMLIGKWTAVNVKLETKGKISDEIRTQIQQTNGKINQTNRSIKDGSLKMLLEFRSDKKYTYKLIENDSTFYTENGSWRIKDSELKTKPSDQKESILDGNKITRINIVNFIQRVTVFTTDAEVYEYIESEKLPDED
ncbi:hypothetical protein BH10BAC5_BH10BAC5_09970 [soil metagenome]